MDRVRVDEDGRLQLPEWVRHEFGDEFRLRQHENRVELVPVPDDPVDGLRDALAGVESIDLETMGALTDERGRCEARSGPLSGILRDDGN